MLIFANIAQTTMVVKVWGDLNAVIEILTTANIPIFCALIKYLVAWYYRKGTFIILIFLHLLLIKIFVYIFICKNKNCFYFLLLLENFDLSYA